MSRKMLVKAYEVINAGLEVKTLFEHLLESIQAQGHREEVVGLTFEMDPWGDNDDNADGYEVLLQDAELEEAWVLCLGYQASDAWCVAGTKYMTKTRTVGTILENNKWPADCIVAWEDSSFMVMNKLADKAVRAVENKLSFEGCIGDLTYMMVVYSTKEGMYYANEHAGPEEGPFTPEEMALKVRAFICSSHWYDHPVNGQVQEFDFNQGFAYIENAFGAPKAYREDAYARVVALDFGEEPVEEFGTESPLAKNDAWHNLIDVRRQADDVIWATFEE